MPSYNYMFGGMFITDGDRQIDSSRGGGGGGVGGGV